MNLSDLVPGCHLPGGKDLLLEALDLRGSSLVGGTFQNCTFRSLNLTDARLQGAVFEECLLEECILDNANAKGSDFCGCTFHNCSFRYSNFRGAIFTKAVARFANFFSARLEGVRFAWGFWEMCNFSNAYLATYFPGASLSNNAFKNCNMMEFKTTFSHSVDDIFNGCDLLCACFDHSTLKDTHFLKCNLLKASVVKTDLDIPSGWVKGGNSRLYRRREG